MTAILPQTGGFDSQRPDPMSALHSRRSRSRRGNRLNQGAGRSSFQTVTAGCSLPSRRRLARADVRGDLGRGAAVRMEYLIEPACAGLAGVGFQPDAAALRSSKTAGRGTLRPWIEFAA